MNNHPNPPQTLTPWRIALLARLTAERHYFLRQLYSLSEETLSRVPVTDNWTAKDLLAHLAVWDAFHAQRMSLALDGRFQDIPPVGGEAGLAARNAQTYEQYKDVSLETAVALALKERSGFLALLDRIPDEVLQTPITLSDGSQAKMSDWVGRRHTHDAAHAQELAAWRKEQPRATGPKFLLRAMLLAGRKEWLKTADFVPSAEIETKPVCGVWTLKDLTGHLTDWEKVGVQALQQLADGHTPEFEPEITDFDIFNNANAAARQHQTWQEIQQDFVQTRHTFMQLFDALPEEALSREFMAPWKRPITAYHWIAIWPGHEHEHAVDVRRTFQLEWPERLMG